MKRPGKSLPSILVVGCVSLLLVIACSLSTGSTQPPPQTTQPAHKTSIPAGLVVLSEQQKLLLEEFSWPHSFTILEVDRQSGSPVRYETWTYFDGRCTYTFLDGVFQFDEPVDGLSAHTILTPYHPDQFSIGMTLNQVQALFPEHEWVSMPGASDFQEGIQVWTTEQLVVGLYQDRLVFVEGLAFVPQETAP